MTKETFEAKWFFRPLRYMYWGSLAIFSIFLIVIGFIGSDVEAAGFFWAGVVAAIYWAFRRLFYFLMFGDSLLPPRLSGRS